MRVRLAVILVVLLACAAAAPAAPAAGWRPVATPRDSGLDALACGVRPISDRSALGRIWCQAVGSWRERLTAARLQRARWLRQPAPRRPHGARSATLVGLTCRSRSSCVAVGEYLTGARTPAIPLVERFDGSRWIVQRAPSAPAPSGYRHTNSRLYAVACPGPRLCFAVGQAVPFGAGDAPGVPLLERWEGRRWRLAPTPAATGPLTAISCASSRDCIAVGGYQRTVGNQTAGDEQEVFGQAIERWDGRAWSLATIPAPAGSLAAIPLGISCSAGTACTAVGSAPIASQPPGVPLGVQPILLPPTDQAMTATWDGSTWSSQALSYPPGAYRAPGTQPPSTSLDAVACQTSASCAAVGGYTASNGDIGPLAAFWNGEAWSQSALRRGPVQLHSIACPALGWCMAVGDAIAERFS